MRQGKMSVIHIGVLVGMLFLGSACSDWFVRNNGQNAKNVTWAEVDSMVRAEVLRITDSVRLATGHRKTESLVEEKLREMGMVDIAELEPSIAVHIVYATPFNFVGKVLYKDLRKAFMLPETAARLIKAQQRLKMERPDLNLIVYDAARPLSVQQEMWDVVKGTDYMMFVSNPAKGGGLHNFGAAVDVSLIDCTGVPLEMGSRYDCFGEEAKITNEEELLGNGRISCREFDNRRLLRRVMTEGGFIPLASEWWHFNLMSSKEAQAQLRLIE